MNLQVEFTDEYCNMKGADTMEPKTIAVLSDTEYEKIKSKLPGLPEDPCAKTMAIAQAINACGIREDRFDSVFNEVCRRLSSGSF